MVYIGETGWSLKKRLQICSEDQQHGERDCSLCLELTTPCRLNQLTESEEEEGIGRHPHYIREQPNNTNLAPLEPDLATPSTLYFTFFLFRLPLSSLIFSYLSCYIISMFPLNPFFITHMVTCGVVCRENARSALAVQATLDVLHWTSEKI